MALMATVWEQASKTCLGRATVPAATGNPSRTDKPLGDPQNLGFMLIFCGFHQVLLSSIWFLIIWFDHMVLYIWFHGSTKPYHVETHDSQFVDYDSPKG